MKTDYLKPGDIVKCIKDHTIPPNAILKKDEIYKVIEITKSKNYRDEEYPIVITTSKKGDKIWSLNNDGPYYRFSDYLMLDIKTQRKEKLLKINAAR